jgi:hypothetical protein
MDWEKKDDDWEKKDDKKKKDEREEFLNWKDWDKFKGMTDQQITAIRQKNKEISDARDEAAIEAKKFGSGGGKKKTKKHKKTLKKKKSKRGSIRKRK